MSDQACTVFQRVRGRHSGEVFRTGVHGASRSCVYQLTSNCYLRVEAWRRVQMATDPVQTIMLLSVVLLSLGGIVGMMIERILARQRKEAWKNRNQWKFRRGSSPKPPTSNWTPVVVAPQAKTTDAADQLRIVMGADFISQPLLNRSEVRVFRELDQYVIETNPGWQVMAQVSLGEILSSTNSEAYSCINSKRVDLLLVDEDCQPRHALEYQGGGHYRGTAAARDAVKKEALRRAGIGYHEVTAGHTTPSDLKRLVAKLVDRPAALPPEIVADRSENTEES